MSVSGVRVGVVEFQLYDTPPTTHLEIQSDTLFVNIQCAIVCSLEKGNFKV